MDTHTRIIKVDKTKPEHKRIPVLCSWCNKIYAISDWKVEYGHVTHISHGLCPDCFKNLMKDGTKYASSLEGNLDVDRQIP